MERLTLGRDMEGRVVFSGRTRGGALVPPPPMLFLDQDWGPLGRGAEIVRFTNRRKSSVRERDPRHNRGGGAGKGERRRQCPLFSLTYSLSPSSNYACQAG